MKEVSDLDVTLIFETEADIKLARKKTADLSSATKWPVDKLFYTQQEFQRLSALGGVAMIAAEDGKVLYSRENNDAT